MMRKLVVGAATAAFLGTAGSAAAGGMYEGEGSMKDPAPVAPIAIWSGLYIGGTVGFGTGDTSDKFDLETTGAGRDLADELVFDEWGRDFSGEGVEAIEAFFGNDYDMDGAIYAGFLGYNWQSGNAVLGIEAGLNGTDFDGHTNCVIDADCHRELDYYGTVTGRLVYAVNNMMFYGFGGVAWGDVKTRVNREGRPADETWDITTDADFTSSFNEDQTHVGWTAGVGIEFAFTERFIAGVEYAHVDLGQESYQALSYVDTTEPDAATIDFQNKVDVSFDVIKVRASYKLWHGSHEPLETFK
jgi:outer membrane immunogenic protein